MPSWRLGDFVGSSPHTRGARSDAQWRIFLVRIIPAYAGSTRGRGMCLSPMWDHPRIRGEHPREGSSVDMDLGSSPHTRGAR